MHKTFFLWTETQETIKNWLFIRTESCGEEETTFSFTNHDHILLLKTSRYLSKGIMELVYFFLPLIVFLFLYIFTKP